MITLNQTNTTFIIIDIQEKLLNAVFNKDIVSKKSEILAKASNILEIPVIVTEQYPKGLGNTITEIKENLNSKTTYYEKTAFNALVDKEVENKLKEINNNQIVIFGIETHICVHQTVSALIEKGYDVTVISDACGSRSKEEYLSSLDYMKSYGAKIKTTEMVLFELIKGAKHPNFKEIQALIK